MCSILTTGPPGKSFRYSLSPSNTHTNLFTFMKSFYSICTFIIQRGSRRFLTSQHHSHKWDSNSVLSGSPFPVLLRQKSTSCSKCQVRSWCPGKDRPPRPRHRVPANDLTRDASDSLSLRKPSRAWKYTTSLGKPFYLFIFNLQCLLWHISDVKYIHNSQ